MTQPIKGKPDRELMLASAESLFAERGFGACSLRDVLGAMGCSTTAFYSRFGTKDEVFVELVVGLMAELHEASTRALEHVREPSEGFRAGVDVLVAVLTPRKDFVRVALSEGACAPGIRDVLKNSFDVLAKLLAAGFERLDVEDPHARAWAVVGAVHMQVFRWAVLSDLEDDELADSVARSAGELLVG